MSSTAPFAGATVPAEGVSLWLARFLQSTSCEEGLSQLLDRLCDWNPQPIALWVWPSPCCTAMGLIGTARYYDSVTRELPHSAPEQGDLARWSFPDSDPDAVHVHRVSGGAICWIERTNRERTEDELTWAGTLLDWIASRESQLRDAKLKSLAEFAAGAGHEINNPLGTILGRSQLLLRQETDPERRRWLTSIGGQALRIRDMISDTMVFARPPAPKSRTVEVEPLIRAVTDRFQEEISQLRIKLQWLMDTSSTETLSAWIDPEQFQLVCVEFMRNAIRAVSSQDENSPRRIGIRLRRRIWKYSEWLELDMSNNGPELTAEEQTHAFDPFFSGRNAGRGLGFGLTKCWRIVTGHGGQLGVHSTPELTLFRSLWPVSSSCADAFGENADPPVMSEHHGRIQ